MTHWLKFSTLRSAHIPTKNLLPPWFALGIAMSLFYTCRWVSGQTPASDRGLIFPFDDFYFYGAVLSPVLWPTLALLTGQLFSRFDRDIEPGQVAYAYSTPLFVWLGCTEFMVWLSVPQEYFSYPALGLMFTAMFVVYVQCFRLTTDASSSTFSRHIRTVLCLSPQLLIASAMFR
ncbi:MAG: hypothetical protein ACPGQS_09740 [Bradymonadia bacterium]